MNEHPKQRTAALIDEAFPAPTAYAVEAKPAQTISDVMMDLVDRLGSEADAVDPRAWTHLLVYAPGQEDGKRYRWLTEDHADSETRARCRSIIESMGVRSYSATSRDIDLAMSECATPPAPSVADAAGAKDAERFLTESDMASLFTFVSQVTDSDADGYTASKETMKRLAEIGCVESKGFGRYAPTMFGLWLIDSVFEQNASLPLLTRADYNAKSAKESGND